MKPIPMTVRGADQLREELDFRNPSAVRKSLPIAEAREHGDQENAEYHAAREQQGFCEGRIKTSKPSCQTRR
ncbi:hypothetical protein ACNKHW_20290 [Shigella flexneri]